MYIIKLILSVFGSRSKEPLGKVMLDRETIVKSPRGMYCNIFITLCAVCNSCFAMKKKLSIYLIMIIVCVLSNYPIMYDVIITS